MIGRLRVQLPAAALSGNDLGQVVHTNVPLFIKQHKLVPCGSHGMKSNEQGEYCRSGSAAIVIAIRLFRLEPLYKLSTLLFLLHYPYYLHSL